MQTRTIAAAFAAATMAASAYAENGVTADRILIGQSASLTGTSAETGQQMREGALAYFQAVNKRGGINGRKIELITLDDAGQTKRGEENTKKLIEEDKVFLLFGYTGRNTSEVALPMITAAQVPFFGAATGGESVHGVFNKYVFNVRASYTLETQALVRHLVTTGQTKIGMIYHKDDTKKSNLKMTEDAMATHGHKLIGSAAVERNSAEVGEALGVLSKLSPQAVVCNAAVKPLGEFVRQMRKAGAEAQFLSVSFVGSAIVKELGPEVNGLIMAQVVPLPTKRQIPIVGEYQKAMQDMGSKSEFSFNALEGYITARVLAEGLKRSGKDLTRAKFIQATEGISELDLGGYFVSYSPTNHNGSKFVDITIISKSGRFFN